MIRFIILAFLITSPALASTEAYFRPNETMILVRGVGDDRDAVELFLSMKAPAVAIGNMWRKQIRVDGAFDLICRASVITRGLGICSLKFAAGPVDVQAKGDFFILEKFASGDGRLHIESLPDGARVIYR